MPTVPALSRAEKRLLRALPEDGAVAVEALVGAGFDAPVAVLRASGGPERAGLIKVEEEESTTYHLTEEGRRYAEAGLPERRVAQALQAAGGNLPMGELADAAGLDRNEVGIAVGWLKRKGWATLEKGVLTLHDAPIGEDERALAALADGRDPGPGIGMLAGRGGVVEATTQIQRRIRLTKDGRAVRAALGETEEDGEEVNQVSPGLVARWTDMTPEERTKVLLRPFDLGVAGAPRYPGKPHPLTQMMERIRAIFWRMGFQEIQGDYVESAYWNMDALFIPQDHPAREEHDTFYLADPATVDVAAADLERGKDVHTTGGGTGSTGWGGTWSADVARQGLLRTHTTNTTVRYLADHPEGDHKVFGLGRVFRNETMDATHLPEFHQIEGIVTEPGASFNMLVGLARRFFTAMGFPEVRFRPAYFPYTEPSMEIDVKYQGKWMELGGCGVFRPEVTKPLGVPHPVLAWGFGLERLAMMRLELDDIRDLYLSDIRWLQETPLQ